MTGPFDFRSIRKIVPVLGDDELPVHLLPEPLSPAQGIRSFGDDGGKQSACNCNKIARCEELLGGAFWISAKSMKGNSIRDRADC
uniref:Uncharacterized protein n=1 Tax=Bionectria ochroleuca TaxID=29856 RepID=A0A0B7K802_BIOOC